jgi:putative nucleotidyltransferase with HDIG domain
MMTWTCSRDEAMKILDSHVKAEHLIRHALTVEAVMRYFAEMYGEDTAKWGIIGLLHDIDFEKYPEQHCFKVRELLSPHGFPEEYMHAIESHGYGLVNDVEPVERMEKVLFAIDELTGLIAATALMRPSHSILDMELSSVKKKWKQKGFAAGVNRDVVLQGAAMLGMELDELIEHTMKGMRMVAEEIGLKGEI